jgi:hypothetical protein
MVIETRLVEKQLENNRFCVEECHHLGFGTMWVLLE